MRNTNRFKRITAVFTASIIALSVLVPTYGYSVYPRDIVGHWAEKDLVVAKEKGTIGGYPDGTMRPNGNVTKAEAIKIINKSFGITGNPNTNQIKYIDVKSDAWYAVDVAIALDNGYLSKVIAGTKLYPNSPATREELAALMTEAMGKKSESDSNLDKFKDRDAIGKNYVNNMATAVSMGLFGGYEDNTIRPQGTVTRGIMAAVANRAAGSINANGIHTIQVGSNDILIERNGSYYGYRDVDTVWVSSKLGEGSAELNNVKAKTKMVIQGGGTDTLTLSGETKIPTVYLEKENSGVALKINRDALVGTILVNAGDYGRIIGNTEKLIINTPGVKIDLEGSKIKLVEVNAPNVEINLDRSTRIEKLVINKAGTGTRVKGSGRIDKVIVNANDCKIDVNVTDIEVGEGTTGNTNNGEDLLAPDMPYISSGNIDVVVDSSKGSVTISARVKNPGSNKANIELVGAKEYNASNLTINKDGLTNYTFTNVTPGTYKAEVVVAKAKAESERFIVDTTDNALANAKASAKKEIQTEFERYIAKDYTALNWTKLEKAKADGDKGIDGAKTVTAVIQARDNALNAMAKVPTKLDEDAGPLGAAKRAAISELESAYKSYNKELYDAKQLELLLEAKNLGIEEIYNASTTAEITLAKNDALKAMANVKTTLMVLKAEAKEQIKIAYESYDKTLYSNKGLEKLVEIVSAANQKIDGAINSIEIDKFKAEALKALEDVPNAEREIILAKEALEKAFADGNDRLDEAKVKYENSKNSYSDINQGVIEKLFENSYLILTKLYEEGKLKITEAEILQSVADVQALVEKSLADFSKVLTKDQEALNTEKQDAKSQIQEYRKSIEDEYFSEDIAKLNSIIAAANTAIDQVILQTVNTQAGTINNPELVKIVTQAKLDMDKVRADSVASIKATLTTNSSNGRIDLKKAYDTYKFEIYTNNYSKLTGIYDKAISDINNILNESEYINVNTNLAISKLRAMVGNVSTIVVTAKKDMSEINTDEEEQKELLLNAKKDFTNKLQMQLNSYLVDKPEHGVNWQKMEEVKNSASSQIATATTVEAVENIFALASEQLKTLEHEKPGLKLAKESAVANLIKNYGPDNYFEEDKDKVKVALDGFVERIQALTTTKITEVTSIEGEANFKLPGISENKAQLRKTSMDKLKAKYIEIYKGRFNVTPAFEPQNSYLPLQSSIEKWALLHEVYYYGGIVPIGSCNTRAELASIETKSLNDMEAVKLGNYVPYVIQEPIAVPPEATTTQKTAIMAISEAYVSLTPSDYSLEAWNEIEEVKESSLDTIMNSKSTTEINSVKNEAISTFNQVSTVPQEDEALNRAKATAVEEFEYVAASFAVTSYSPTNWESINQIKGSTELSINSASTVEGVNQAKDTGIAKLKSIKTKSQEAAELTSAKAAAKKELTLAYSKYNKANYTTANWSALTKAKTNGDTAITYAKTLSEITKAKQNALTAMANVKRK